MNIPIQSLWILGGLSAVWIVVLLCLAYCTLRQHEHPRFESHWGGLGRGLGGWSMNWTLVLSLVALVLTGGVVAVAVQIVSPPSDKTDSKDTAKKNENKLPATDTTKTATSASKE